MLKNSSENKQLVFNESFQDIIEEKIDYWQNKDAIPSNIINFINQKSKTIFINDEQTGKNYCSVCLNALDDNFYCQKCHRYCMERLPNVYEEAKVVISNIKDIKDFTFYINYYVFDCTKFFPILYIINERIYYDNPTFSFPYRTSNLNITNACSIEKDSITDLIKNKKIFYSEIEEQLEKEKYVSSFAIEFEDYHLNFLYTENLEELKSTVYQYSKIWKGEKYLQNAHVDLLNLVYAPLYFPGFEYLINCQLYSLAFDRAYLLKYDAQAKKILDARNGYLDFMIKNNFNYDNFMAMKLYLTKDISIIYFISSNYEIIESIIDITNIDIKKLKEYLMKNNYEDDYLYEYYDYLELRKKLGFNLKDKDILFPNNLLEEHNSLYLQYMMTIEPEINNHIEKLSSLLSINSYQDENYVIFPADSVKSLIDEGKKQNNCVRTYSKAYSQNKLQIYFMRKKSNLNKSFVTIEVMNNKVVQARVKNNLLPSKDIEEVLNKWEKTLILVINTNE